MAKKRLQKKREAARAAAQTIANTTSKAEPLKVTTKKIEPLKVQTSKTEPLKVTAAPSETSVTENDNIYCGRVSRHLDELKWLYCELYQDDPYVSTHLNELLKVLQKFYNLRSNELKALDLEHEANPFWYLETSLIGKSIDVSSYSGTFSNLVKKLDYIQETGINLLHLNHVLHSSNENAVIDHRKVQDSLGTMDELSQFTSTCHEKNIHVCVTLPFAHTSCQHSWARHAYDGEKEYQNRYFLFDNYDIPSLYDQTCPEEFPVKAPGNFTWLEDIHKHVMTTFDSEQWDLNYRNPVVLNEMIFHILYLANQGIDVIQLEHMTHIWKQLGTNCRDLPQVHTIIRIIRMACEIVCPSVLLLGEISNTSDSTADYLGTAEKPECHLLYDSASMSVIWHTAATRDVSLIRHQLDKFSEHPECPGFVNMLRDRNEIHWNLDYDYLTNFAIQETPHKEFLNSFLSGKYPDCFSRGEVFSQDPGSDDFCLCGTTASLCGIERAGFENNTDAMSKAIRYDLTLHAFLLSLPGIPMFCAGDELGLVNDYSYKDDPEKSTDSRNLHKVTFDWTLAENRHQPDTVQGKLFPALQKLSSLRKNYDVLSNTASCRTIDTWDNSVLALVRESETEKFIGIYNFSESDKVAWINEEDGIYRDLISGNELEAKGVQIPAFGCFWLYKTK